MPGGLTPKGQQKLQAAINAAAQAAQIWAAREAQTLRAEAARRAPSAEEEAELLSRGVSPTSGVLGTPEGGRFVRQGGQTSLREAIATDPIRTRRQIDRITAGIGNVARINTLTGFYWGTRRRGIQGPTEPFNRAYLQAVENGGAIWVVVPRPDNRSGRLEPEPDRVTRQMIKTMPPFRMYSGALGANRSGMVTRLREAMQADVRRVGIA
jgi:hypothetical protein